jgi:selenocysteine lyase/cysteine desulfurase
LELVPYPDDTNDENWIDAILSRSDDTIVAACLPPLHWSDGSLLDLVLIGDACRHSNIPLIVDSTQATGILKCSVAAIPPTLLCCSAHKWLRGPSGLCLVYVGPQLHNTWEPLDQHNRGRISNDAMINDARRNQMDKDGYHVDFCRDARKFDSGGKTNALLLPMLNTALEYVATIDVDQAQAHLKRLMSPLLDWAKENGYMLPVNPHCYHLIGIRPTIMTIEQMIEVATTLAYKICIFVAV